MFPDRVAKRGDPLLLTQRPPAPHKAPMKTIFAICGICIIG
jgi:hypothetical protein